MIWLLVVMAALFALFFWSIWDEKSHALIDRFKQVDLGVYRGHQPETINEYKKLQELGIKTIINLREEWVAKEERPIAEKMGFNFHSFPMSGFFYPNKVGVAKTLAIMADPAMQPVFVHCTYGKDRTGLIIGLYRRFVKSWTKKAAWAEMWEMGFNPVNFGCFLYFWIN